MSDTVEQTTELAILSERALVPAEIFKPGGVRIILDQIKAEVAGEKIDVTTEDGRAHCRSLAFKIARSKTALDAMGKTLSDEWRKRADAIHAERRLIEKELDALRDRVRAPLTAYLEREKKRVAGHIEALNQLQALCAVESDDCTVPHIDGLLDQANVLVTTRVWDEFREKASDVFASVTDALKDLRETTIRAEKEREEAARLQAEREEQARLQTVREQEAREARIAAEAAQRARQEAEEQAKRDAIAAANRAIEERQRALREEQERHAEEMEAQHQLQVERDRVAAAEKRRAEAAARAEAAKEAQAKYAAEREALREEWEQAAKKQASEAAATAATAERQLIEEQAEAQRRAAAAREADKKHHAAVNRAARDAIEKIVAVHVGGETHPIPGSCATAIVTAIALGEIPNVRVTY